MKNYYDILGVKTNESISNIEKAYNTLVSKYNPDSFQGEAKELDIYGPKGTTKYFKDLIDVALPEYSDMDMSGFIHYHEIENFNEAINLEGLKVKFFQLKHGELEDIAYTFDDGVSKVGFSGDCTYTPNLDKFVASADTLFLECCDFKTTKNHLGCDQYLKYSDKYPNKKFYAVHCVDNVYQTAESLDIETAKAGQTYYSKELEKEL